MAELLAYRVGICRSEGIRTVSPPTAVLRDLRPLLEVVARAQELNILGSRRASTFGEGKIVVEVEPVRLPALNALPAIPLPDLLLNPARNEAPVLELCLGYCSILAFRKLKLELEHLSSAVSLSPRVNQAEAPVVRPDARLDLFVHSDASRSASVELVVLGCAVELAVLGQLSRGPNLGLVDALGIVLALTPRDIVSLVSQG